MRHKESPRELNQPYPSLIIKNNRRLLQKLFCSFAVIGTHRACWFQFPSIGVPGST